MFINIHIISYDILKKHTLPTELQQYVDNLIIYK